MAKVPPCPERGIPSALSLACRGGVDWGGSSPKPLVGTRVFVISGLEGLVEEAKADSDHIET